MEDDLPIIFSGWLRKRRGKSSTWKERYFVLKGTSLHYYLKPTDVEAKGILQLHPNCKLSEIRTDTSKKKRVQYVFRVSWSGDEEAEEGQEEGPVDSKSKRTSKTQKDVKEPKEKSGYISSMLGWAGFSSGETIAFNNPIGDKDKQILFATDKYEDSVAWISHIENALKASPTSQAVSSSSGLSSSLQSRRSTSPPLNTRLAETESWLKSTAWRVFSVTDGVRIFEYGGDDGVYSTSTSYDGDTRLVSPPCLRVNISVTGSVGDAFMTIMSLPPSCRTGTIKSMRIVEVISNCIDIIHIELEPIYVFPTWTVPRDLCLQRYWKQNFDGSHVICMDSVTHDDCPPVNGCIRAELHAAYVICPPKISDQEDDHSECMITFIAQMNPRGWIWKEFLFQHNFLKQYVLHTLDIRDALHTEKFVQVHFDPSAEGRRGNTRVEVESGPQGSIGTIPPPVLTQDVWSDIDASTFKVRGPTYIVDKVKSTSAPALFKLVAVDLFEVPEPTQNICSNPRNRVYLARQREEKSWVFVMNIMVPGPPYLSFVAYMEGNPELFEQDTPFGRIAKPFFYGNDDVFRNNRFKLIPKIIDGNMIIKMAVKDTPALLGNKLKQYYHKGDNYFEIDIDVGSSSIARNVVGLAIGYSKAIVVDMGLCLQGDAENELPEVLLGGCSCIHIDCSKAKKL